MKVLRLFFALAFLSLSASCSDDPVSSGNGAHFTPEYHPTLLAMDGGFSGVCGAGTKDLYAIGPALLHYDGTRWITMEQPATSNGDLSAAIGFPDGRVVVSGSRTFVLENGAWRDISDPDEYGYTMWGSSPDDLYKVGFRVLRHFDGTSWSTVDLPGSPQYVIDVTGRSSNDVIVSAEEGRLIRFDGAQWTSTTIDSNVTLGSLAITDSGQLFGATYGEVYEVTDSTEHMILNRFVDGPVLCAEGEALYMGGNLNFSNDYFVIARFENNTWENVALDHGDVRSMWAGRGSVLAGGDRNFLWRGAANGGVVETPCPSRGYFNCATTIDGAVYVGGDNVFRYENGAFTDLNIENITRDGVDGIAGRRRNSIYAIGRNMVLHYDGSDWSLLNSGFGLGPRAIWVDEADNVWVAGYSNEAYRLHGSTWSPEDIGFGNHSVYDMWGDDEVLIAVGSYGTATMRKDGVWRPIPTGSADPLYAVWGYDQNHIYAADGYRNQVYAWDGRSWHGMVIDALSNDRMSAIWGTTASNVFAIGNSGTIVRYDGNTWQPLERIFARDLGALSGTPSELLAVGYIGAVSYHR
jgi:hypothetical protein